MRNLINQRFIFLYKFLRSPKEIGSVTPSSTFLIQKMMGNIQWNHIDCIVELGAGTGVVTEYIYHHKNTSTKAIIIEKDDQMRNVLENTYPSFYFGSNAENLDEILKQLSIQHADCIISSLPFANFSPELRLTIVRTLHRSLKPGGIFVAFQYSLQMKTMLSQYFKHIDISFVPLNVPPAFVYHCLK